MYVINPTFIPIISILRILSLKALKYKSQIDLMKRENYDITNFENTPHNSRMQLAKMFH